MSRFFHSYLFFSRTSAPVVPSCVWLFLSFHSHPFLCLSVSLSLSFALVSQGWRVCFFCVGGASILLGLLIAVFLEEIPRGRSRKRAKVDESGGTGGPAISDTAEPEQDWFTFFKSVFSQSLATRSIVIILAEVTTQTYAHIYGGTHKHTQTYIYLHSPTYPYIRLSCPSGIRIEIDTTLFWCSRRSPVFLSQVYYRVRVTVYVHLCFCIVDEDSGILTSCPMSEIERVLGTR